jgi:hypothetical protein
MRCRRVCCSPSPAGVQFHFNVWDGDGDVQDETLGADDAAIGRLQHRASRDDRAGRRRRRDADREARFDAGLIAIHNAVKRGRHGPYLGGAVDLAAIEKITRSGGKGLVTDGLPNIKAAEVTVLLTFTSSRPF